MDIFGIAANCVAILGGAGYAGRSIWRAANIVRDNTAATEALSARLDRFSTETAATLADHGTRLARLETRSY